MIWSQFSTKVLQMTIHDIDDWDRIRANQYSKENSSLEQNSFLHNEIYSCMRGGLGILDIKT